MESDDNEAMGLGVTWRPDYFNSFEQYEYTVMTSEVRDSIFPLRNYSCRISITQSISLVPLVLSM